MRAMITVNLLWLHNHKAPSLYQTKPRYLIKARPFAIDGWQDMPTTIQKRSGDCKDFVAYRCAELIAGGKDARPIVKWDGLLFHFQLEQAGGIEDPSEILGMSEALSEALRR